LAEQRRIAKILDTADEAIRQTERLIAKLKLVKAGLLHDLLTRGLDEHGHLRDPQAHPEQFKDSPLGKIPGEWAVRKLANITTQVIDGTHFTPTYVEYGVPFLRVTDIQSEEIDFSRAKRIPEREHRSLVTRCKPEIGDILYSKNGTIGIAKLVDWDIEFSIFVSLALIKPIPSVANPHYLTEVLGSFHTWSQIRLRSKQMTLTNLHLEEIKEFLIPLPSLTEQGRIILALDAYAARIRSDEAALEKLRQVKRGLMDDLLTGRVRVKS
jgi:type I restriction enzyme S subunit